MKIIPIRYGHFVTDNSKPPIELSLYLYYDLDDPIFFRVVCDNDVLLHTESFLDAVICYCNSKYRLNPAHKSLGITSNHFFDGVPIHDRFSVGYHIFFIKISSTHARCLDDAFVGLEFEFPADYPVLFEFIPF